MTFNKLIQLLERFRRHQRHDCFLHGFSLLQVVIQFLDFVLFIFKLFLVCLLHSSNLLCVGGFQNWKMKIIH